MQYFKHFSKMRNDVKIKRLISKYGIEGYGLYVLVLESIVDSITTDKPMPILEETCEDLAEFYGGNTAKIDEMMRFMVDQGLFSVDLVTKKVACYKIYGYIEQSQTRSEKIRELITAYKDKGGHFLSETVCDKSDRIEENRIDKNRKEKKRTEPSIPTLKECIDYQKEKNLNANPTKFYNYYESNGWKDSKGKPVLNWKQKMIQWDSHATDDQRPKEAKPYEAPKCPCGGEYDRLGLCKACGTERPL